MTKKNAGKRRTTALGRSIVRGVRQAADFERGQLKGKAEVCDLARLNEERRDRRDRDIINRNAARLNREAQDTLEYQRNSKG